MLQPSEGGEAREPPEDRRPKPSSEPMGGVPDGVPLASAPAPLDPGAGNKARNLRRDKNH